MTIETERLILRRWEESDAESLYEYAKDPDVGPRAGWAPHKSVEESRVIIKSVLSGEEAYAICLKEDGRAIGAVELMLYGHSRLAEKEDECELGYWIGKPFWGRGLVTEASRALLKRAFGELGMSKVWAGYYEGNTRSQRVQEKLGLRFQRRSERVEVSQLNETRTGIENAITREQWMRRRPILAICYDFDKTLSPDNMQAQGYLQAINYENQGEFWAETNKLAEANGMDTTLAWMFLMLKGARGKEIFRREMLERYGAKVRLYDGVASWFDRICRYGEERGIIVEHYIISSGLREMIDGTEVAGKFEKIYASSFYYDEDGVAVWPAQVVNFTNKTQFLFRISKGVLGINDDGVNDYFAPEDIRVPFRNMVYIGDSDTDIPCMKLVNSYGGHSIGVYDPERDNRDRVHR
ncbi:MAG: GNAT family N-acetyltransferase, partial [Firmicutes bacterium]|nr:GNAT family N-acetyltransferase [Bacillota bacterium]